MPAGSSGPRDAHLLGIEFDPDIFAKFQFSPIASKIISVNESYVHLQSICARHQFSPTGILFDLGVSSHHYEIGRGFTFRNNEPLDMRFNPSQQALTAADIVNGYGYEELEQILSEYGEEQHAGAIAKAIMAARQVRPIASTGALVEIIEKSVPSWYHHRKIHPATKTFQALRIAVNDEIHAIRIGLVAAMDVLESGGRLAVISFHGLEDKTVREIIKARVEQGDIRWVTKDTIKPRWEEVKENPRARSAKMKIVEKI